MAEMSLIVLEDQKTAALWRGESHNIQLLVDCIRLCNQGCRLDVIPCEMGVYLTGQGHSGKNLGLSVGHYFQAGCTLYIFKVLGHCPSI